VYVFSGTVVGVIDGILVLVGKNVGVIVAAGISGVDVAPMTIGVGLTIAGVRVGSTKGVGGL